MANTCFAALESFHATLAFDSYNIFNSHTLAELSEAEAALAAALPTVRRLNGRELASLRSMVDSDLAAKLSTFALRMASAALRTGNEEYLIAGTIAITIDDDVLDPRDVYLTLAVLFDAGSRLSCTLDKLIEQIADYATPTRKNIIIDGFLAGPTYMRSLKSMGITLQNTPIGPTYTVHLF